MCSLACSCYFASRARLYFARRNRARSLKIGRRAARSVSALSVCPHAPSSPIPHLLPQPPALTSAHTRASPGKTSRTRHRHVLSCIHDKRCWVNAHSSAGPTCRRALRDDLARRCGRREQVGVQHQEPFQDTWPAQMAHEQIEEAGAFMEWWTAQISAGRFDITQLSWEPPGRRCNRCGGARSEKQTQDPKGRRAGRFSSPVLFEGGGAWPAAKRDGPELRATSCQVPAPSCLAGHAQKQLQFGMRAPANAGRGRGTFERCPEGRPCNGNYPPEPSSDEFARSATTELSSTHRVRCQRGPNESLHE